MTSIAGVQFVLIGDDPGAKPVLVDLELVKGDNRVRPFFYGFYPSFWRNDRSRVLLTLCPK